MVGRSWTGTRRAPRKQCVSLAGLPLGTVDKVDIAEVLLKKIGLNLPNDFLNLARKNNIYPLNVHITPPKIRLRHPLTFKLINLKITNKNRACINQKITKKKDLKKAVPRP